MLTQSQLVMAEMNVSVHAVQLKGNLTNADRAYTTYWLKTHGYINRIVMCGKENLPKLIFKRQERRLRRH